MRTQKISCKPQSASEVHEALDGCGIQWQQIGCHNWSNEYPYKPEVAFRMAHNGDSILLEYDVHETCIRALAEADNGPVWEDSCCEFFIQPDGKGPYYNVECNCAGIMLIGCGTGRDDRVRATAEMLQDVSRWSSLGTGIKQAQGGDWHWQLALIIPATAFFKHQIDCLDGLTARCNFYKCGDKLCQPHFLSWQQVKTDKPNFHLPEFFGECVFE